MTMDDLIAEGWEPIADQSFLETMGGTFWRDHDGRLEIGLLTAPRHRNASGLVHGGVYMTLVDRALGMTARRTTDYRRMATATLTVNFLRPAKIGDFITVTCTLSKNGRKAAFGEAVVMVGDRICCTATGVFMTVES